MQDRPRGVWVGLRQEHHRPNLNLHVRTSLASPRSHRVGPRCSGRWSRHHPTPARPDPTPSHEDRDPAQGCGDGWVPLRAAHTSGGLPRRLNGTRSGDDSSFEPPKSVPCQAPRAPLSTRGPYPLDLSADFGVRIVMSVRSSKAPQEQALHCGSSAMTPPPQRFRCARAGQGCIWHRKMLPGS